MATDARAYRRADVPIRIYALAKDLKIDSKELVEFCNKAGIPGKGSALASLEDDEVSKLRTWMEASSTKRQPSGPAPLVDTKAVLSSPVSATATLPPPPPPRTAPIRTRPATPAVSVTPAVAPPAPAARPKEAALPTISARAPATELPPPLPAVPTAPPASPLARAPVTPSAPQMPLEPAAIRGESLFGKRTSGIRVLDAKTKRPAAEA